MAVAALGQLNTEELPGSRSINCFEKLEQIGEGTYGQVFMARETKTGEIVALKKIRMDNEKEGFPITAIREIKILKKLHHENIVKLKEIVTSADSNKSMGGVYMVFEYMDHDLTGLADRPGLRFSVPQIKCYIRQLLCGLQFCHVNEVLHRDIKGSNLLIDNEGKLKLADFGLARKCRNNHEGNLTNRVITLWYRPPELLLGATKYGPAIDMWSVGCIFAELLYGKPILQGKNEPEQLNKIFELCGSPDEISWPDVSKLPWYNNFKPARTMKRRVRETFRHFDPHALDLLDHLLTLDPNQRCTVEQALDAEYFRADPLPCDPMSLPKYESSHEFQTKKRKQQQQQTDELRKRSRLAHPPKHQRLPPIQNTGKPPSHWHGPNHPNNDAQLSLSAGPRHHHYGMPHGPLGGSSIYAPNGNQAGYYHLNRGGQVGGYSAGPYPPPGRAPPYAGSGMAAPSSRGAPGGYGVGPPSYSQSSQYGVPGADRGTNIRNQQYGRQ